MSMSMIIETLQLCEIDVGDELCAVTFTANGEHLVSGSHKGVRVWQVADGKQVATMPATHVLCVAASNDGRWIAGGTWYGELFVWDSTTAYDQVRFADETKSAVIFDIHFSPDSTRFVSADGPNNAASIWDIAARQKVRTLDHDEPVAAAKYSPQGDRIATATEKSVRVWDNNDGRLLVDIEVQIGWVRNLLWCNSHLFVKTNDGKIKQIDSGAGSTISEWPVPHAEYSSVALPPHGTFIACSAENTITFWGTTTHSQLGLIQHTHNTRSLAWSSDGQFLAIAAERTIVLRHLFHPVSEPELVIDNHALDAWRRGRLADAEAILSAAIPTSENRHHAFASRALVRVRLRHWHAALVDANESIEIQRTPVGYVAKCVALVGKGETDSGCRVCDSATLRFPSDQLSLLLTKAVALFMAGKHVDAISRMDDLITDSTDLLTADPAFYVVQAYMHLLCGNMRMENSDYEGAVHSFEDAQIKLGNRTRQPPLIVSLISGWEFDNLAITIQQRLCEALFAAGRIREAGESVLRMVDQEINLTEIVGTWISDFKFRCRHKLEDLGDSALNAKQYDEAISQYKIALLLEPASLLDLLVKRSRAYAQKGMWRDALNDANEVIELDLSLPSGHERKYAALLGMGQHDDAIDAFETMLSKMSGSRDPEIRERSRCYVQPGQTKEAIRTSIQNAIRDSPLVLINALSGRLCDKSEQAAAFELTPVFMTLIASMTTHIDHALIEQVVGEFYRYATFSHTWEGNEPLYGTVTRVMVYDLRASPTHEKLQMFCKVVRDEGFIWAWSDTCCIDKGDHFILQEALVSMFKWYEGSAMTVIFLYDVDRLADLGALMNSKWNSRGWTLQEYHASKVVRIYTKDWTPYLGLTIHNHKESPEVISEMEKATGISARALMALRPGLNNVREKLRLASTRQTTRVEDAAYSLLGIFSMTLPVTYGEGDKALGRLLSQLLTSSGDTSILAWTGTPSSFNSCLPTNIVVFSQPVASYVPRGIPDAEMEMITAGLHASELDLDLVTRLYDRVDELPTPTFAAQRMRLPCLAFKIRILSSFQNGSEVIFRARASVLGFVEIKSSQNLEGLDSLYLVHPWIDFLLDRRAVGTMIPEEDESSDLDDYFDASSELSSASDTDSLDSALPPSPTVPLMDMRMQFLARLRQPFGALLLAPTRRNMAEYKRIATESLITVQVQEITAATLNRLIQGVRVLDVL